MGASLTTDTSKQTLSEYTQFMNTAVTNIVTQSASSCDVDQTYNFTSGQGCFVFMGDTTVSATQTANTKCALTAINDIQSTTDFQNFVQSNTLAFIKQNAQQTNGFFHIGESIAINKNISDTDIATDISNSITTDISTQCSNTINVDQKSVINLCGIYLGDVLDFNQDANVLGITSCINDIVQKAYASNGSFTTYVNNTNQYIEQKNKGAGSLAWAVLGPLMIIFGVLFLVIMVVLIALFYYNSKNVEHGQPDAVGHFVSQAGDATSQAASSFAQVAPLLIA
ncbi:Hypothetical protein MVR_LOCUS297 [uncultured virus]|nr:Hypothetical protein MVR_LOCUS297 [uncultured virus]